MADAMNRDIFDGGSQTGFSTRKAKGKLPDPLPSPLRLNLGCGFDVRPGFVNIDLFSDDDRVVGMDVRKLNLPDSSADLVLASDILEHFSHREVDSVLMEWARVLKPGGEIIIRCPSLKLQAKAYTSGAWDADAASFMIFGGQSNPGDFHCIAFDENSIGKHLTNAGFEILQFEEVDTPQDKGLINLNMTVRARKKEKSTKIPSKTNSEFSLFDFDDPEEPPDLPVEKETAEPAPEAEFPKLNIVWEGSQFVYHSLALINREHSANMIDSGLVNLTIVPYEKDNFDPSGNAKYEKLKENDIRFKGEQPEWIRKLPYCWIRHQWPPNANPPKGAKWIIIQPWEFTRLRKDFAEIFNLADEVWTPSNFSRQAFVESGVEFNKVQIIPNGIDPELFTPTGEALDLPTKKRFKLLYVGGTIYRKGIDILLQAYIESFSQADDVCLVVKDMGGDSFYKGQTAKEAIEEAGKNPDAPDIIYNDKYLTEEEMAALYRSCDVFISPYRGEGFSMPTLEAMASGLPVVVTKGGATDDFVDEFCGWFIRAEKKSIGNLIDGHELSGEAFLLEPDKSDLSELLKMLFDNPATLKPMGMIAAAKARKYFNWKRATNKIFARLDLLYDLEIADEAAKRLYETPDGLVVLGEAERTFYEGKKKEAPEKYIEAISHGDMPDRYRAHALRRLSMIYFDSGNVKKAEEYSGKAEEIDPGNFENRFIRAKLLDRCAKHIEALEAINPVVEEWDINKFKNMLGIGLDEYLCFSGELIFKMGDSEGAHGMFTAALKSNPENADACYGAGLCFKSSGINDQAKNMFEWAIKLNPHFSAAKTALEEIEES